MVLSVIPVEMTSRKVTMNAEHNPRTATRPRFLRLGLFVHLFERMSAVKPLSDATRAGTSPQSLLGPKKLNVTIITLSLSISEKTVQDVFEQIGRTSEDAANSSSAVFSCVDWIETA